MSAAEQLPLSFPAPRAPRPARYRPTPAEREVARRLEALDWAMRSNPGTAEHGARIGMAGRLVHAGHADLALSMLRTLARNYLGWRRGLLRWPLRSDRLNCSAFYKGEAAGFYWFTSRMVLALGPAHVTARREPVTRARRPRLEISDDCKMHSGETIAKYGRAVPNPSHPELTSHGVYVSVQRWHKPATEFRVELEVYPPDFVRSQMGLVELVKGPDAEARALRMARDWAELGEALIAVTLTDGAS